GVGQGNRLLRRNDRAILQHFEIVDTHTYPIPSRNHARLLSKIGDRYSAAWVLPESFTKTLLPSDEGFVVRVVKIDCQPATARTCARRLQRMSSTPAPIVAA